MSLVMSPFLLDDPRVYDLFPRDAIERARNYLVHVKGGIGAYSDSKGNPYIRQEVRTGSSLFPEDPSPFSPPACGARYTFRSLGDMYGLGPD